MLSPSFAKEKVLHLSAYCHSFRDWGRFCPNNCQTVLDDIMRIQVWRAHTFHCDCRFFCCFFVITVKVTSNFSFRTIVCSRICSYFVIILWFWHQQCCQQHQWTKKQKQERKKKKHCDAFCVRSNKLQASVGKESNSVSSAVSLLIWQALISLLEHCLLT